MIPADLPPFNKDIAFVQGDDFDLPIVLGVPTSGYAFEAYLVPASGQVSFDVVNTATKLGQVAVTLGHEVTDTIPAGVYPWQFSFTDAGGLRSTWYQGLCTVKANA